MFYTKHFKQKQLESTIKHLNLSSNTFLQISIAKI